MNTLSVVHLESEVVILLAYTEFQWEIADSMKYILEPSGFHFVCAEGIAELMRVYQERHDEIDLVVVLTYRFQRTEAPAVLDALQAVHPGVRCAFITGLGDTGALCDLIKRGAVGVVRKPFQIPELQVTLRKWSLR